ncbi:hypothetical protein SAY86_018295 [Trapa natans]|uniref:Trichome birefringence-like N-terminal domain-containing protein n=1 Tax=Trapa natans TaxID=22666 RepID=A0AAN7LCG4_TRANT|nr:hypothetical protein SAY86_018295 [Trapa natans]
MIAFIAATLLLAAAPSSNEPCVWFIEDPHSQSASALSFLSDHEPQPKSGSSVHLISCYLLEGDWVEDHEHYPIYKKGSIPVMEEEFNCTSNGRPQKVYQKFRLETEVCDISRQILNLTIGRKS